MLIIYLGCGQLKFPSVANLYTKAEEQKLILTIFGNEDDKDNYDVIGIDVCRHSNDIIASALFSPIRPEVADIVVTRQFIEHVDTQSLVREIYRILKDKGKLLVETPNALFVKNIWRALRRIETIPYIDHIQIFTSAELTNLLTRNGFKGIKISYFNIDVTSPNYLLFILKKNNCACSRQSISIV